MFKTFTVIAGLVFASSAVASDIKNTSDIKNNGQFFGGVSFSHLGGADFDYRSPAPSGTTVAFSNADEEAETDSASGVAARVGYDFEGFLRAEVEYTFHQTELDSANNITTFNKNELYVHSVGINLIGEYNNSSRFTPYVHAGAGAVIVHGDVQATGSAQETFSDARIAPAISFGAGTALAITSWVELDLRYRAAVVPIAEDLQSVALVHGVTAGVNFRF